ncbi:hypothetical protein PIB30_038143 [Stylosanthes scabra]|uniref:Uncharacterized protein n=1 Tax=Stylosanthes scabra TaxID=79078 RepID=A0ABU6VD85_9FABA|nr:hypothetical protein [Stylosanthes scabra]
MVLNTLANNRASVSRGTQLQPLSKAITKPRHLSESLLPEDKHSGSGDYWTDNIFEDCVLRASPSPFHPLSSFTLSDSVAIIFISTNNSLSKLLKFRLERQSPLATRTPSLQTIITSVQSLRSTWGERVSSMSERLIDFKAQLTIQRNELRGLRNDFQGCAVISS